MRNSTVRSLSCVGYLTLGPAGSALEAAQAVASHLGITRAAQPRLALAARRDSWRRAGRRPQIRGGGSRAGRARASRRPAVAADWIGDDLGGLPAPAQPSVGGCPAPRPRPRRAACCKAGGTRCGQPAAREPVRRRRGCRHCLARAGAVSYGGGAGTWLADGGTARYGTWARRAGPACAWPGGRRAVAACRRPAGSPLGDAVRQPYQGGEPYGVPARSRTRTPCRWPGAPLRTAPYAWIPIRRLRGSARRRRPPSGR